MKAGSSFLRGMANASAVLRRTQIRCVRAVATLACIVCSVSGGALVAQAGEVLEVSRPQPALVPLGGSSVVELVVRGEQANLRAPNLPQVEGLRFVLEGPARESSITVINGRRTMDVRQSMRLTIVPSREGRFVVPPFEVPTGTRTQLTPELSFEVTRSVAGAERGFVELRAAAERVYTNEPIRFEFDFGVDERLDLTRVRAENGAACYSVYVSAPWFENPTGAVAMPAADAIDQTQAVPLVFNNSYQPASYTKDHARGGTEFHRFRFTKTVLPTSPGTISIEAPVLRFEALTGPTRRSLFGETVGSSETMYAYGEPLEIAVLPIPTAGRPASYGNAVGRFSLEASATPRRLRVGDSVKWSVTVRGTGNTEFLDPPSLPSDLEGFHSLGANVHREADLVRVTFDLTPLDATVAGLPAITWSWFDTTPGVETFVEKSTEPIPLEIEAAAAGEGLTAPAGDARDAIVAGVDDIHDIFERNTMSAGTPIVPTTRTGGISAWLWLLAPWLASFGLAWSLRRSQRRRADVRGRRAAAARKEFKAALHSRGDATAALTAYLAARLGVAEAAVIGPDLADRLIAAQVEPLLAGEVAQAIEAGTAAKYGGASQLDAAQAERLVDALERAQWRATSSRGAGALAGMSMLLLVCCGAVTAAACPASTMSRAQDVRAEDPLLAAERAYRAGDYATAAAHYAELAERPGADRRLFYNLGNSLYRQGEFARALLAYERARLAMPRDAELLANIALVERKLELGSGTGESFWTALTELRDRFTAAERLWLAVLANTIAALALVFGRGFWRWLGGGVAALALVLSLEVLWFGPARPAQAIVLDARVSVFAEPRVGLDPLVRLRRGVSVALLGVSDDWASVRVDGRQGYVRAELLGAVD